MLTTAVDLTYSVVVPTLNAAKEWPTFAPALLANVSPEQVLIIDSSSTDGTPELARNCGFRVLQIERSAFNHGATRQLGVDYLEDSDVVVYLTQDAILRDAGSIQALVSAFQDEHIGAAFGRQLPRADAGPIESHARMFNYPPLSSLRSLKDRRVLGIKTAFFSNSFGAYRRSALKRAGGFPTNIIFGEDTVTIARLLLRGWDIAYVAEAEVLHSHAYSPSHEFKRYFDIGVLHSREKWMLEEFGYVGGEGLRFALSELSCLVPKHLLLIPSAVLRTLLKLAGYRMGHLESRFNSVWKRRLSMHSFYWSQPDEAA